MFIIAEVSGKTVTTFFSGAHYINVCLMCSILIALTSFVGSLCVMSNFVSFIHLVQFAFKGFSGFPFSAVA